MRSVANSSQGSRLSEDIDGRKVKGIILCISGRGRDGKGWEGRRGERRGGEVKGSMLPHSRVHSGSRCEICGRQSPRKSALRRHRREKGKGNGDTQCCVYK